ncbi:hypothetical protein V2H45_11890 [Tumidithrix elongata RA019]|uniref:MFS transporter n=1 Tax=Tumidithrix elongata BACA0141 TaxID=2716417 RepID=A0AAW9PZT2_9CYAN|nr:hypothetical protein [Tumidithrix elongata RA019]
MNTASSPTPELLSRRVLKWVNLRPEEAERTLLMFLFYAATSIGAVWLEASSAALFLGEFGAENLTWVYMATAAIVTGLGVFYSWLQKHLPLRRVMLGVALLLAFPLPFGWFGLHQSGIFFKVAIFSLRLWVEAVYVLGTINNDIAANQLFNIREIKRAFPLISTGIIIAEIVSGFSLPLIIHIFGISGVTLAAFTMLLLGAFLLFYLSARYRQAFPNAVYSNTEDGELSTRRLQGNLQSYVTLLFGFFIAAQILFFLIDYQYYAQLEIQLKSEEAIAQFVGIFGGVMGIFKLSLQLFGSSRIIERLGVFLTVLIPPIGTVITGLLAGFAPFGLLIGFVILKFFDELFRFTIVASTAPTLFQAVPDQFRSRVQSLVRGIADPLSIGGAGILIWLVSQVLHQQGVHVEVSARLFAGLVVVVAAIWICIIWLLRRGYLQLLIQSVERGQLSLTEVDIREVRRAVTESLVRAETDLDQSVCIELLSQVAPQTVGESLAPLLVQMAPDIQKQSLEAMLIKPDIRYLRNVKDLLQSPNVSPQVQSLCLRYVLLADEHNRNVNSLRSYLGPEQNPIIRGTAVALMMRLGTPPQVAEATNTLRQMITSPHQPERVLGCRALAEATYMQSLRFYVPQLLQDSSIEVRCALLQAIAATRASEYFPSIIRGLHYKATRKAAYDALVELGDYALDSLVGLTENYSSPENVRLRAWEIMGDIGTPAAVSVLANSLSKSWGKHRRTILRTLIRIPKEVGIETVLELIGRNGVEQMVEQELIVMAEAWVGIEDIPAEQIASLEAGLLKEALLAEVEDSLERLFLLMKLLYTPSAIQAAAFNIMSGSKGSLARGIEILDNTVDLSKKQIILSVLDKRSIAEKLRILSEVYFYQPMSSVKRLRNLIEISYCFSDWTLACCFHVGRSQLWSLPAEITLQCLSHPTGFVREAVLAYLQVVSPRSLQKMLPMLTQDRNSLVGAQAKAIAGYFGLNIVDGNIQANQLQDPSPPLGAIGRDNAN